MLETIQAEAIYKVRMSYYEVGSTFRATEVFPPDSHRNDRLRSVIGELVQSGIIGRTETYRTYQITEQTIAAYDEWFKAKGWKRDVTKWRYE